MTGAGRQGKGETRETLPGKTVRRTNDRSSILKGKWRSKVVGGERDSQTFLNKGNVKRVVEKICLIRKGSCFEYGLRVSCTLTEAHMDIRGCLAIRQRRID